MNTALSYDPILTLVVQVLSRIENRTVDFRSLSMAAIVRNGYYIGLSYKSECTLVVWRSSSDSVEFYDRKNGTLIQSVKTESPVSADLNSISPDIHPQATLA